MTVQTFQLDIEGRSIPLTVRRNGRARRMILRLDTGGDGAVVTIPPHNDAVDGLDMARRQSAWLSRQLKARPERLTFREGAIIPYLGEDYTLHRVPGRAGITLRSDGGIYIPGDPRHLARRLTDWFRKQARQEITTRVYAKALLIERTPGRVTIRDTRTRWGSCSAKGNLSFSWRLMMAPESVLDYVVAHEVAHLAQMNHSARFWQCVGGLSDDMESSRAWLREHGERLHRIG